MLNQEKIRKSKDEKEQLGVGQPGLGPCRCVEWKWNTAEPDVSPKGSEDPAEVRVMSPEAAQGLLRHQVWAGWIHGPRPTV